MNTKFITRILGMAAVSILLTSCAEYPDRPSSSATAETMSQTETQPQEAVTEPADLHSDLQSPVAMSTYSGEDVQTVIAQADEAIDRAGEMGGLWSNTDVTLKQAKAAYNKGDFDGAMELAEQARAEANMAYNQAMLEQAVHMVNRVKSMNLEPTPEMQEKIISATTAYESGDGELAYETGTVLIAEAMEVAGGMNMAATSAMPAMQDEPPMEEPVFEEKEPTEEKTLAAVKRDMADDGNLPDQYEVAKGDSLWKISGKPVIYDNPYQWPLIYKANQAKIKDPDVIQTGQVLDIDRNVTPREVELAVKHAKSRGSWSLGGTEEADRKYLLQSGNADVASR